MYWGSAPWISGKQAAFAMNPTHKVVARLVVLSSVRLHSMLGVSNERRATNLCWGSFFLIFKWLPHLANISRAEEPRSKRGQCDKQPSAIQIPINCICRFFCFNRGRVKLFYLAPLLAWQLGCKELESTKPLPDKMAEIRI